VMHVLGLDTVIIPQSEESIQVLITTGQNALQREASFTRMIQTAAVVQPMDPTMGVDGVAVMQEAGAAQQFQTKGFFFRRQPDQPPAGVGDSATLPEDTGTAGGPQPGNPVLGAIQPLSAA